MTGPLLAIVTNPKEGGATFSLRHRLFRALWGLVWSSLGIWTPTPMHGWRRTLVGAFGAQLDRTAKIYPGVKIWYPPNLIMGRFATLGPGVNCYSMAKIELGEYALVSQRAHLCAGTHDVDDPAFQLYARPILIGREAWVAAEAFVGPGVMIGEGAVLGARAVTMKSLEAGGIYAGNPARRLRARRINLSGLQVR